MARPMLTVGSLELPTTIEGKGSRSSGIGAKLATEAGVRVRSSTSAGATSKRATDQEVGPALGKMRDECAGEAVGDEQGAGRPVQCSRDAVDPANRGRARSSPSCTTSSRPDRSRARGPANVRAPSRQARATASVVIAGLRSSA